MPVFNHPQFSNFTIKLCGTHRLINFEDNIFTTEDPVEIEACRNTPGVLERGNDELNAAKEAARDDEDRLEWEQKKGVDGQVIETKPIIKNKVSGRKKDALNVL